MSQGSPRELLVFSLCWNPENAGFDTGGGNRIDELASKSKAKWAESQASFFHVLYMGCHKKVGPRFRVGLPASNNQIMKIPHRSAQQLGL